MNKGDQIRPGVQQRHLADTDHLAPIPATGKTTFINTLCESEVIGHKVSDNPETAHIEEGIRIKPVNVELDEDGMRIGLTIVDTPGFGQNIDNEYA